MCKPRKQDVFEGQEVVEDMVPESCLRVWCGTMVPSLEDMIAPIVEPR